MDNDDPTILKGSDSVVCRESSVSLVEAWISWGRLHGPRHLRTLEKHKTFNAQFDLDRANLEEAGEA